MTLTKWNIARQKDLDESKKLSSLPKDLVLGGFSGNAMIAVLGHLGQLAEFSANLFKDLNEEASRTFARVGSLNKRIGLLDGKVAKTQQTLRSSKDPIEWYRSTKVSGHRDWRRVDLSSHSLFSPDTRPPSITKQRAECNPLPPLSLLDKFSTKGECVKMYSNSRFFIEQWIIAEKLKQQKMAEERNARRKRRKRGHAKKRHRKALKAEEVVVKTYSAMGKEFDTGAHQAGSRLNERKAETRTERTRTAPGIHKAMGERRVSRRRASFGKIDVAALGNVHTHEAEPEEGDSLYARPGTERAVASRSPPPIPQPDFTHIAVTEADTDSPRQIPTRLPPPLPPLPPNSGGEIRAPPPIPPTPGVPQAPIPQAPSISVAATLPSIPEDGSGVELPSGPGGLLAGLRGVKLRQGPKPVAHVRRPSARSGLMVQIRQVFISKVTQAKLTCEQGFQLRKVEAAAAPPPTSAPAGVGGGLMTSIMEILSRRDFIEGSDSESDEEWEDED